MGSAQQSCDIAVSRSSRESSGPTDRTSRRSPCTTQHITGNRAQHGTAQHKTELVGFQCTPPVAIGGGTAVKCRQVAGTGILTAATRGRITTFESGPLQLSSCTTPSSTVWNSSEATALVHTQTYRQVTNHTCPRTAFALRFLEGGPALQHHTPPYRCVACKNDGDAIIADKNLMPPRVKPRFSSAPTCLPPNDSEAAQNRRPS